MFKKKQPPPPWISAVIVAAGSASRMNGIDKQLALLNDIPIIAHSIRQFEISSLIAEIVVVCREEQIPDYYHMVQDYDFQKVASVVKGGENRQQSVFGGISACADHAEYYAIHDGARPLVTGWEIERCIESAIKFGSAAVGTPVKDTIKICSEDGFIQSTPDRESLVSIRTPQIFAAQLYRDAMNKAAESGEFYTDDCQLVENMGAQVAVSLGSYENIKITTPDDLAMAQAVLTMRMEEGSQW